MDDQQVKQLIQKYIDGQTTAEETALLESWYLQQSTVFQRPDTDIIDKNEHLMLKYLESRVTQKSTFRIWPRIAIASAIAFILIGAYFFRSTFTRTDSDSGELIAADITPGKEGATLTLANGRKIYVNDALTGNIASESGVKISKTKDGQIIYEITGQEKGKLAYNTLTTSRGEQIQVHLPDGSLVFLNAASSLKYPTSFSKSAKRSVSLTGEGYFEIAKVTSLEGPRQSTKRVPFVVTTDKQEVEVLGTHFNINAYSDEKVVRTTLLEGSVRVSSVGSSSPLRGGMLKQPASDVVLKPGQQSALDDREITMSDVDPGEAVAWQKGYFSFYDEDITSVMRKICRWYNVDVDYAGQMPQVGFNARIDKFSSINDVLEILEKSGAVHFSLEGRKVIVSK